MIFQFLFLESYNGFLWGFKIVYCLVGVVVSIFIIRKIENIVVIQGNIDSFVQWIVYEIKVLVYNDVGDGMYSNLIIVIILEGGKL